MLVRALFVWILDANLSCSLFFFSDYVVYCASTAQLEVSRSILPVDFYFCITVCIQMPPSPSRATKPNDHRQPEQVADSKSESHEVTL